MRWHKSGKGKHRTKNIMVRRFGHESYRAGIVKLKGRWDGNDFETWIPMTAP
jgi:hypothetical protein